MGRLRERTWIGLASGLALVVWTGAANAELTFEPDPNRRMTVTDRSTATGLQARVWSVTAGDYIASKRPDVNQTGWDLHVAAVESGIDAVSWTDGSTQRERVFFAREDEMKFLNFDNDAFQSWGALPAPATGIEFRATDVAAVTWTESSVRKIGVAAISTDGRVCVWTGETSGFTAAPFCTAASTASTSDPDIDATAVSEIPVFTFRGTSGSLSVVRRSGASWFSASIGIPPGETTIGASVDAFPSPQVTGTVEVAVTGNTGRIHTARFAPLSTTETWTTLPVLPDGATPASQSTALAATTYLSLGFPFPSTTVRTALYVASSSRRLYRIYSGSSGAWSGVGWSSGTMGTAARPPGGESYYGVGLAFTAGDLLFSSPTVFGVGGVNALFWANFTLQEFNESGFRDHVHIFQVDEDIVLGNTSSGTKPATESTVSVAPLIGHATALRRNSDGPWQVVLSESSDAATTWSNDFVVQTAAGWAQPDPASLTDPITAIEPGGTKHHLVLEVPINYADPSLPYCTASTARRLVYRAGGSTAAMANRTAVGTGLRIVSEGNLDHGGLALTYDATGTTAHSVVWEVAPTNTVKHWARTPAGVESTVTLSLPGGPPGIFTDAAGTLFAWSGVSVRPTICRLGAAGNCIETAVVGAGTSPNISTPNIFFGVADPADPMAECPGDRRCFDTQQPFAFATHPTVANQIYAVYQGLDPDGTSTSVFFQKNDGASLSVWTTPVRVHARGFGATEAYVDPSVTVDGEGTIVVTYSKVPGSSIDNWQYVSYSTDGGTTWTSQRVSVNWRSEDLPFHCSRRKFFLGEYREGSVLGNRAFNQLHKSSGGNTVISGFWGSRWSMTGF
jgi:hypothetical protein